MLVRLSRHVSSHAVAYLALFLSLGSSSYAAVELTRNNVRAPHIAPGAVGTSELRNGAVAARDLSPGLRARIAGAAPRLFATVSGSGVLRSGTASSAVMDGAGTYTVRFAHDVSRCAVAVTPGANGAGGSATVLFDAIAFAGFRHTGGFAPDDNASAVSLYSPHETGAGPIGSDFHLVVAC